MEGGGEEEHAVGQRWTRSETVVLANALKAREEEAHDIAAKSAVGTASDKWETVSKFCRSHGVSRSSAQCNSRWSKGLFLDYKKVRDWQKNEGVESYWKMKEKKRREHKLPGSLDEEVFNVLVSFLDPDLKQTGTPESEVDSDRPASHVVSPASAVEKIATEDRPSGPSAPASGSTPSIHSGSSDGVGSMSDFAWLQARTTSGDVLKSRGRVPPGDDKTPAAPSQKRRRASTASPIAAPVTTAAERVDNAADAVNIKPIHFNVPPNLEIPRFGDPNAAERISTPHWDGQSSLGSLEGRLLAQNEAVWNRVRILNEQVVQMVEMSNQRLLSQMQTLFTQIRLQIQVFNAQMQTKVQEATQSLQVELQTALKAHTEQVFNQLHAHGPSSAGSHPYSARGHQPLVPAERPTQNGNWPSSDSAPMPTPPDIHVDFSHLPVPPLQPVHMPAREKERIVRQRTTGPEQQGVAEGLPAPPRTLSRLLPHVSDFQKSAEAGNKPSRLPPHISDVDRMLRQQHQQQQQQQQQQAIPLPSPLPSWNQASFVISELDRVLGQKPLDIHIIPPAPGPMAYSQAPGSVKLEKILVPVSSSSHMGLNMGHNFQQGPHPGHHFAREAVDANPRHAWSEGIAMPGTLSGNPNQSLETSSGQDVEPSSRHPASSSGTVDGEETTQDSGQDTGAASSEKQGGASNNNHRERGGPARGARGQLSHPNNRGPRL